MYRDKEKTKFPVYWIFHFIRRGLCSTCINNNTWTGEDWPRTQDGMMLQGRSAMTVYRLILNNWMPISQRTNRRFHRIVISRLQCIHRVFSVSTERVVCSQFTRGRLAWLDFNLLLHSSARNSSSTSTKTISIKICYSHIIPLKWKKGWTEKKK